MKKEFRGYLKEQIFGEDTRVFEFKRWANYGKDRIYITNGKVKAFIDLQKNNEMTVISNYEIEHNMYQKVYDWFFENYEVK